VEPKGGSTPWLVDEPAAGWFAVVAIREGQAKIEEVRHNQTQFAILQHTTINQINPGREVSPEINTRGGDSRMGGRLHRRRPHQLVLQSGHVLVRMMDGCGGEG
jgi:hypothetical protein